MHLWWLIAALFAANSVYSFKFTISPGETECFSTSFDQRPQFLSKKAEVAAKIAIDPLGEEDKPRGGKRHRYGNINFLCCLLPTL